MLADQSEQLSLVLRDTSHREPFADFSDALLDVGSSKKFVGPALALRIVKMGAVAVDVPCLGVGCNMWRYGAVAKELAALVSCFPTSFPVWHVGTSRKPANADGCLDYCLLRDVESPAMLLEPINIGIVWTDIYDDVKFLPRQRRKVHKLSEFFGLGAKKATIEFDVTLMIPVPDRSEVIISQRRRWPPLQDDWVPSVPPLITAGGN